MVSNLITAQVIRYVTDKVMENLARQAGRALPTGESPSSDVTNLAVVAQVNKQFERLGERLADVETQLGELSNRLAASEKRAGWRHTFRMTFGIVCGIALGVGAMVLVRLAGWIG